MPSEGAPQGSQPVVVLPVPRVERRVVWQWLVILVVAVAVLIVVFAVLALVRGAVLAGERMAGAGAGERVGLVLALTGLALGDLFLLYSLKYYVSSISTLLAMAILNGTRNGNGNGHGNGNGNGNGNGLLRIVRRGNGNGNGGSGGGNGNGNGLLYLEREPFVSIHIATYNERRVVQRLLEACAGLDYHSYEIVVVDDSTDETREILAAWEGRRPGLKVVRRPSRDGFKGGALAEALRRTDPRAEYVVVYDADSVPFPDSIQRFLPYFYDLDGGSNSHGGPPRPRPEVAAVQSYQWHVLNKGESWLTEAVRAEYAGSYMVERPFQESMGLLKMVAGTSYMIRADVLRELGWGRSLTEDWQLTLDLYTSGYKVVYTPYAETPAECVGTFSRLTRQRMRWAEGHSHNVRRSFGAVMRSGRVSPLEKLEFLYYSLYYLQAALFVLGTLSWLVAEVVLHVHVPAWTAVFGWSLLITNMLALPLMNAVGLVLEDAPARDLVGVLGALAISFLLVPFQAWAAVKGMFEREEGPWFRTPKTGRVTEAVRHLRRVRRWLGRRRGGPGRPSGTSHSGGRPRRAARRAGWVVTGSFVLALVAVAVGAVRAPGVAAASSIYLGSNFGSAPFTLGASPFNQNSGGGGNAVNLTLGNTFTFAGPATSAAQTIPAGAGNFSFTYWISSNGTSASTAITFFASVNSNCSTQDIPIASTTQTLTFTGTGSTGNTTATFGNASPVTVPASRFFCLSIKNNTQSPGYSLNVGAADPNPNGGGTHLNSAPTIFLPERALLLAGLALLAPALVRRLRRRRPC